MKTLYTARAHNKGGRDGRATAADGHPDLVIKPPAELGGPSDLPEATNPEELFALGFGACFLSALSLVARGQKISAKEFTIDSAVDLVQTDDGGFGVAVELHGTMPGVDDDKVCALLGHHQRDAAADAAAGAGYDRRLAFEPALRHFSPPELDSRPLRIAVALLRREVRKGVITRGHPSRSPAGRLRRPAPALEPGMKPAS